MKWYKKDGEYRQFENDPGDGWTNVPASEAVMDRIAKGEQVNAEEREKLAKELAELRQAHDEAWARATTNPMNTTSGPEPVSLGKIIRGATYGDWQNADYERDLLPEFKERATTLSTANDSYGGFIVPPEYLASEFVEMLYNSVAAFKAGVRQVNVSGGPVVIPTHQTGATAYWLGDDTTAITASDQTFGQKTAQPHPLAALCRVSNALLRDSNPSVESIIRQDIATTIGVELDNQIWNGNGASGKPVGILNTTGVHDAAIGAAITPDYIFDTIKKIEDTGKVNVEAGLSVAMSVKQWYELMQASDGAGTPKFSADVHPKIGKSIASGTIPIVTTHNLGDGYSVTGVFREALLLQWGGLAFAASEHASDGTNHAFTQNLTFIRAIMDVDLVVRQPKAFCLEDGWT